MTKQTDTATFKLEKAFKWKKEYAIGDFVIDEQHQKLFELGNKVWEANLKEAREHIIELYKYTKFHFKKEEEYMENKKYDDLENHKIIHSDLVEQLEKFLENGITSDQELFNFKSFVWKWIYFHILQEDVKYQR